MDLNCFFYPEVYLPDNIKGIFSSITGIPQEPIKPKPPKNVGSGDVADLNRIFGVACLLTIVITVILIVIDVHTEQNLIKAYLLMAFLFFVCTAYFIGIIKMRMENKKYKRDLIEYQKELERYDEEVAKLKSDSDLLASYRKDALKNGIKKACNRDGVVLNDDESDIKEGPGETFFHSYLLSLCSHGFEVYSKCKVAAGKSFFYPDFALIDEYNLCYDIEIDEPYSLGDKTPIHYLQYIEFTSDYQSIDFGRNSFFTEKGWVVIRFSERQVYEDPIACVQYILDIQKSMEKNLISSGVDFPDTMIDQKWTEDESIEFARRHYRDSYINSTNIQDDEITYSLDSKTRDISAEEDMTNQNENNIIPNEIWDKLEEWDDLYNRIEDEYGVIYSRDGNRLIGSSHHFLRSYIIKDNVKVIGNRSFADCWLLESVTIPQTVTTIEDAAFAQCYPMDSITIPEEVNSIGKAAFINCKSLKSIIMPSQIDTIEDETFAFCSSLDTINIPRNVKSIGENAFYNCKSLKSIIISCNVKNIGRSAFYGCSSLKAITIPRGITTIEDETFAFCSSLISISIPFSVTKVGYEAFYCCHSIVSISIPSKVKAIGAFAFSGCSSLKSITIPDNTNSLGDYAFAKCKSLQSITFSNNISIIGEHVFEGCSSLKSIIIPKGTRNKFVEILPDYKDKLVEQ